MFFVTCSVGLVHWWLFSWMAEMMKYLDILGDLEIKEFFSRTQLVMLRFQVSSSVNRCSSFVEASFTPSLPRHANSFASKIDSMIL